MLPVCPAGVESFPPTGEHSPFAAAGESKQTAGSGLSMARLEWFVSSQLLENRSS
jgi:hypothetical protein